MGENLFAGFLYALLIFGVAGVMWMIAKILVKLDDLAGPHWSGTVALVLTFLVICGLGAFISYLY